MFSLNMTVLLKRKCMSLAISAEKRAIFQMCDLHRNMCPEGCVIERQTEFVIRSGKDKEELEYHIIVTDCAQTRTED
jgi:hypothetical protein